MQKDLDKLECCLITRNMKFNKSKPWILHLGQGNPGYMYRLEGERLESNLMERDLGILGDGKWM